MSIIEYLSNFLSVNADEILNYISTCPHRYKVYKIPKRNGKDFRIIAQPAKELKYLQSLVLNEYLSSLPVHSACKSYVKKINIRDNALVHVKSNYLLKMDFKDFFPSITPKDLLLHIDSKSDWKMEQEDEYVIEKLFFYSQNKSNFLKLSIGSPASPFISNTIMYDFDSKIAKLCNDSDIVYSRYADDISFSTNKKHILFDFKNVIETTLNECEYPNLTINSNKTVFLSRKGNMHITGLVLSNERKVSLGRKKKRFIRSLVFQYINKNISDENKIYLKGYLSFCVSVEPSFIESLNNKYGAEVINRIRGIMANN